MKTSIALVLVALLAAAAAMADKIASPPEWSMNATIIEACSCPMFCQCYFNTSPAGHSMAGHEGHMEHFCRFNNAFMVKKGNFGATKLDGAKFWVYGDLGAEFSGGEMDWAVLAFDKSLTPGQRDAIVKIVGHIYPVKWKSFTTSEGDIAWVAGSGESHALLDGGKTAEVRLSSAALNPSVKGQPMVIKNLKYWGLPRNDGFVLMPNTVEAVRAGDKPFEYKGGNGFMLSFDVSANDFAAAATK